MPKILCGTSCRRDPPVLEANLRTICWQVLPPGMELRLVYADDLTPGQRQSGSLAVLKKYADEVLPGMQQVAIADFDDKAPETHLWSETAFDRVAYNKQMLLEKAVRENFDYIFFVDTDLILDPRTLGSLYATEKDIVAGVYWTRWQNEPRAVAGPQVWLRHPYALDGRGLSFDEFRTQLANRALVKVWGLGACMLVRTEAIRKGLRYWPLLPQLVERAKREGGMWAGEDRTFSVIADSLRIGMWADAWPNIFHAYQPADAVRIAQYIDEFSAPRAERPPIGDLVSLILEPLEEPSLPKQHIRGRLGALPLLPELESAILTMGVGDSRIVRLRFPVHYPIDGYRGQQRLVNLTLVDFRPYGYVPVLRDEFGKLEANVHYDRTFYQSA